MAHGVLLPSCRPRGEARRGSGKLGRGAGPPAGDARRAHRYIPGCAILADWARAAGHADGLLPHRGGRISARRRAGAPHSHDGAPQAARAEGRASTGDSNMSGSDILACSTPAAPTL
jgi:hypothetical protein